MAVRKPLLQCSHFICTPECLAKWFSKLSFRAYTFPQMWQSKVVLPSQWATWRLRADFPEIHFFFFWKMKMISYWTENHFFVCSTVVIEYTLFESENEWQKTKPVLILLPRPSRNFPNVKTRNEKKIYNWTSEIIPFICFEKQMNRAYIFFWNVKSCIFYSYPTLLKWVVAIFPLEMVYNLVFGRSQKFLSKMPK